MFQENLNVYVILIEDIKSLRLSTLFEILEFEQS